jgi:hypothetical protein
MDFQIKFILNSLSCPKIETPQRGLSLHFELTCAKKHVKLFLQQTNRNRRVTKQDRQRRGRRTFFSPLSLCDVNMLTLLSVSLSLSLCFSLVLVKRYT